MAIEDFTCTIKVKPITKWVEEQDEKSCHPCLIKPLAGYYMGTLQENKSDPKAGEMAKKLEKAWESSDVLTIAQALDSIKTEVGDDLHKELMSLDCFAQTYQVEEEVQ